MNSLTLSIEGIAVRIPHATPLFFVWLAVAAITVYLYGWKYYSGSSRIAVAGILAFAIIRMTSCALHALGYHRSGSELGFLADIAFFLAFFYLMYLMAISHRRRVSRPKIFKAK